MNNQRRKRRLAAVLRTGAQFYNMDSVEKYFNDTLTGVQYVIAGAEVGEQGTKHVQGYIQLQDRKYLDKALEVLARMWGKPPHIERQRARSNIKARDYCKKDGVYSEWGTFIDNNNGRSKDTSVDPSTGISKVVISPYNPPSMTTKKTSDTSRKSPSLLKLVKQKPKYYSYTGKQNVAKRFPHTTCFQQLAFHTTKNHQETSGSTGIPVNLSWFLKNSGAASPSAPSWGSQTSILRHSRSKEDTCQ